MNIQFCSECLPAVFLHSSTWFLGYRKSFFQRFSMTAIVGVTSILSVSSGPLTALAAQMSLLCWNGLLSTLKFRWKLLIALAVSVSLAIELVANRSVLDIVVSYFLFDPGSYWFRKLIWIYGTESVLNHPLWGTGLERMGSPGLDVVEHRQFLALSCSPLRIASCLSDAAGFLLDFPGGEFQKRGWTPG